MLSHLFISKECRDVRDGIEESDLSVERAGIRERTLEGQVETTIRDVPVLSSASSTKYMRLNRAYVIFAALKDSFDWSTSCCTIGGATTVMR